MVYSVMKMIIIVATMLWVQTILIHPVERKVRAVPKSKVALVMLTVVLNQPVVDSLEASFLCSE